MKENIEKIVNEATCYEDISNNSNLITRNDLRNLIPWNFNFVDQIESSKKNEIVKILSHIS